MLTIEQLRQVVGTDAYDDSGNKIGKVGQVFLDDQTDQPEFVTINTGLFGTNENFVPVKEATFSDGRLTLPYSKDRVKDSPNVDVAGGHISQSDEQEIYRYFDLSYSESRSDSGLADAGRTGTTGRSAGRGTVGRDTSGPETDTAMTRSEERLDVGTRSEEAGRARLRKYVVTEEETHTIPVRKEKAVLETEPVTDANRDEALEGPELSDEEHEVTLREERPVVGKTTEPVERVRLGKEEVAGEETVTEQVRKERIEAEGDIDR
jgi:uncharacterized protein (TIGR02271 family)